MQMLHGGTKSKDGETWLGVLQGFHRFLLFLLDVGSDLSRAACTAQALHATQAQGIRKVC